MSRTISAFRSFITGVVAVGVVSSAFAQLPGAIFTTDSTCSGVDLNIYTSKLDVHIDGGPSHPGAASLPDGSYYVQVTDPSGAVLLGTSIGTGDPKPFVVANGAPLDCYQLWAIVIKGSDGTQGYDDTPNNGNEYKVWVSTDPTFTNSSTKTDNFKAFLSGGGGGGGGGLNAVLGGAKYDDCNGNGKLDLGEHALAGWTIQLYKDGVLVATTVTTTGGYSFPVSDPGTYTICEVQQTGYLQTGPAPGTVADTFATADTNMCWSIVISSANTDQVFGDLNFFNRHNLEVTAHKFYDANVNGVDDDNLPIQGWEFTLAGVDINSNVVSRVGITDASGNVTFDKLLAGDYTLAENKPLESGWMATTADAVVFTLQCDSANTNFVFGNVCLGSGGGLTIGFWSNKNGLKILNASGAADLTLLDGLNLRNANGSNFDPATYKAFQSWILNANAVNMAYMLSAQLAAMELNVASKSVSSSSVVYAPGCGNMGANNNFITIADLMNAANTSLFNYGYTPSGNTNRVMQQCLESCLDNANNNQTFVHTDICPFTFPPLP